MGRKHVIPADSVKRKGKEKLIPKEPSKRRQLQSESDTESESEGYMSEGEPLMADAGAGAARRQDKKRDRDEAFTDRRARYVESLKDRPLKNERQVDERSLKQRFGVEEIRNEGLEKWFEPLPGYNARCVREFYANMSMVSSKHSAMPAMIKSKVGPKEITISAGRIAEYLGYTQPDPASINYPREEPVDRDLIRDTLFDEPEHASYPFKPSKFTETARILNQAIHYNLYPRGKENKPSEKSTEIMTVFLHPDFVVDWALYIFGQLCDFCLNAPMSSRCWFPCMITSMCIKQGVKGQVYTALEKLNPGPIDKSILERSRSQSRRATSQAAPPAARPSFSQAGPSSSRPKSPKKGSSVVVWLKQLLQCHRTGLKNDEKIMKKQERLYRGQRRAEDKADWVIARLEASTGVRYVLPPELEEPEEEEEDEDDDEEEDDSEEE